MCHWIKDHYLAVLVGVTIVVAFMVVVLSWFLLRSKMLRHHRDDAMLQSSYRVSGEQCFVLRNCFRFHDYPDDYVIDGLGDQGSGHSHAIDVIVNLSHLLILYGNQVYSSNLLRGLLLLYQNGYYYYCCYYHYYYYCYFVNYMQLHVFRNIQGFSNRFAIGGTTFHLREDRSIFYNQIGNQGVSLSHESFSQE